MIIATISIKWDEIRQNILDRLDKSRNRQLIKLNSARERSIGILQNRYGYTREQAIYQLDKHYSRAWLG